MRALVGLYLVAQFTTSHLGHNFLTYHNIRFEHFQVGVCQYSVVIRVDIVNLSQVGSDEVQEVLVVIHNGYGVILCFEFLPWRTYGGSEFGSLSQ